MIKQKINRLYTIEREIEFELMFLNFIQDDFSAMEDLLNDEKQLVLSRMNAVNYFKDYFYKWFLPMKHDNYVKTSTTIRLDAMELYEAKNISHIHRMFAKEV